MSINWFPGHMHKARKEIAKTMDEIDVVIEVLDARLPQSSENPLVDSLRKGKPVIKLLNKSDLADPDGADLPDLADPGMEHRRKVEHAMDAVRAKLGTKAIEKGRGFRKAIEKQGVSARVSEENDNDH